VGLGGNRFSFPLAKKSIVTPLTIAASGYDPSFGKRIARRSSLIESYRDPEFQALRQRYEYIFGKITMINSGGWFIYIVPVAVGVVFWKTLCKMVTRLSAVSGDDFPELSRGLGDACVEPA